jgi:hypothetical protein
MAKRKNNTIIIILFLILLVLLLLSSNIFVSKHGLKLENMYSTVIPKVIFQTSIEPPEEYVINMIRNHTSDWIYKHFTDKDIIQYFREHPLAEFDNIESQFNRLNGAHKADLFRYYYLYVDGGVFMDSDAMFEVNINEIAKDYDFFSVESLCTKDTIFQGLIGSVSKNEIIYKALQDAYTINPDKLAVDYFLLVKHLHNIVHEKKYNFKIKLYYEKWCGHKACIYDDDKVIVTHYCFDKKIPRI